MTQELGSAHGKIVIDTKGVQSGVQAGVAGIGKFIAAAAGIAIAVKGIELGVKAAARLGTALLKLGSDAQETAGLIQNSLGASADEFAAQIEAMAAATGRSKNELAQGASTIIAMSRAMGFGQARAAEYSASWAQIATDLGSFFNQPTEQVFEDIQGALAGSTETMQKYGIDIRETTLQTMALNMGLIEQGEKLDRVTRAELIMSAVMGQAADAMGDAERTSGSLANQMRALRGEIVDAGTDIGSKLIPQATEIVTAFRKILPGLLQIGGGIVAIFSQFVKLGVDFVKALARGMGVNMDALAENSGSWGQNIVVQLAAGMAAAASAVIQVLQYIGNIITSWLAPGSPPALLPELDQWGADAMTVYMDGWAEGDFSVFNEISATVSDFLRSLGDDIPETDLIPQILGARSAIAEAIAMMNEVGSVSQAAFDEIFTAAGITDQGVQDYVSTLFQLQMASESVVSAQAAVVAAQDAVNAVNEEYAAILDPLTAQLQALHNEQQGSEDAEELAGIERRLAEERLTAGEREALMQRQREIQLQQQIQAIEEQQAAAVDAAEENLTAAEEQLSAAELAQQQVEQQAAAQQALIDLQIENNNLLADQNDLLAGAGGAAAGVGAAAGAVGSLGSALAGLPDLANGAMAGIGGLANAGDLFANKFDEVFARVEEKFKPLEKQVGELGKTWAGILHSMGAEADEWKATVDSALRWVEFKLRGLVATAQNLIPDWQTGFDQMATTASTAWTTVETAVTGAIALIEPAIATFVTNTSEGLASFEPTLHSLGELWTALQPVINAAIGLIVLNIVSFLGVVVGVVNGIAAAIDPFLTTISFVVNGAINLLTGLIQFVTGFFQFLVGMNQENNAMVEEAWQRMGDGITNIVTGLFEMIVGAFVGGIVTVIALVDGFVTSIIAFFTDLYEELVGGSIVPDMVNAILQWFSDMVLGAVEFVTGMVTDITTKFTELKTAIAGKLEDILGSIQGTMGRFRDAGAALIDGMRDGVMGAIGGLVSAVTQAIQDALNAAQDLLGNIPGFPGGNNRTDSVGNYTSQATGMGNTYNNQQYNRQSTLIANFNGGDRVRQATNMNTLRAANGGV